VLCLQNRIVDVLIGNVEGSSIFENSLKKPILLKEIDSLLDSTHESRVVCSELFCAMMF